MVQMAGLQQAWSQAIRLPVAERADAGRPGCCAGVPKADPELCYPSTAAPLNTDSDTGSNRTHNVNSSPVVRLHDVRHTLALMMYRAGQALADAAALLGHTVVIHLATYVPLTEKGARTAASGLGAAMAEIV
jgi:hypothetical protein